MVMYSGQRKPGDPYAWEKPKPDVASQLAMDLFGELNKGYVALAQFRGRVAVEIERSAPGPLKQPLKDIDLLISAAEDQVEKAIEEMRRMAPGTMLQTLGRKPPHLPGR